MTETFGVGGVWETETITGRITQDHTIARVAGKPLRGVGFERSIIIHVSMNGDCFVNDARGSRATVPGSGVKGGIEALSLPTGPEIEETTRMSRTFRRSGNDRWKQLPISKNQRDFEDSKIAHIRADSIIKIVLRDGSFLEAWFTNESTVRVERLRLTWEGSAAILFKQLCQILDEKGITAWLDSSIVRGNLPMKPLKFYRKFGFRELTGQAGILMRAPQGDEPETPPVREKGQ